MRALITHLLARKQAALAAAGLIPPVSSLGCAGVFAFSMPAGMKHLAAQPGHVSGGFGYSQKQIFRYLL